MMKKIKSTIITIGLFLFLPSQFIFSQNEIKIWKEFVKTLKENKLTLEQIQPYQGLSKETLIGFLDDMRAKADWTEWDTIPEIHSVDNQVHFLIPLTFDDYKKIFETIWQDRAYNAGWSLKISYEGNKCIFHFEKD